MLTVSKSRFKAKALEYFRRVERTRQPLLITDRGKAVLKLVPCSESPKDDPRAALRGTVLEYADPTEPVALLDWEALR